MKYVPGTGNPSAKLMLVGEAPGANEEEQGLPFVGPAGEIVNDCLRLAGTDRSEVYVTNVCKVRPPNNEIRRLEELGVKLEHFIPQLWQEVEAINPNCILAIGNTALKALTGETGINNFRGSILPNKHSGVPKVVASIHPASLFHNTDGKMRSYRDKAFIQFDFQRAVQQSLFREYRKPDRLLHIAHNSLDLIRFLDRNIARGFRRIAYDIETFKAIPMCISFAFSRYESISVPLFDLESKSRPDGIPLSDMEFIWRTIADLLLDTQYSLIGHNLKFDQGRLENIGLPTTWPYFDTQLGFHTMYPELPKKLAFVASVLTEEPYYKDDLEEYNPKKQALEKRLIYNARDSAVTFEVFEEEYKHLEEVGMLDYFFEVQMPKHKFYYQMERRGIKQDLKCRKWLRSKYERYSRWLHTAVTRGVGHEVNVNSNGMGGQVAKALFLDLKCPVRKDTRSETLNMLMLNAVKDDLRRGVIKNMLQERKVRKTVSTYLKCKLWPDERIRTTYNITGTETDRTSTSKPKPPVEAEPMGIAFQTLTKHGDMLGDESPVGTDLRRSFIPDDGMCFIEPDLSQSQARMVAWMANDFKALEYMNRKDFVKNKHGIKDDLHTWTTQLVTSMAFEAITEDIRQLGKKTRHAGNFGMGKRRLSFMAQISEWRAGQCLEKFHAASPMIANVYWAEIKQALQDNDGVLVSPMGAQRKFFDRWGEELFKQAYAHLPQIIESEHVKAAAIRIEARAPWMEFLGEFHDSFLAQIPIHKLHEAYQIIKEELEKPIDFRRCSISRGCLVIPCDMKVGYKNWESMVGYKAA
jgi:uracil-DNA glycosylase